MTKDKQAETRHIAGLEHLTRNELDAALPLLEESIRLAPNEARYRNNYGVALLHGKLYHAAKQEFLAAVSLQPGYADAWANLGRVRLLLEEDEFDIETALHRALAAAPNHVDALSCLAELRDLQGRYRDRAAVLLRLAELRPDRTAVLLRQAAEALVAVKDYDAATPLAERAAALDPTDAELQKFYGECLGELGKISEAKTQLRRAGLMNKNSVWRWKHLWYCPVYFENREEIDRYWNMLHAELDDAIAEKPVFDWRTLARDGFTSSFELPHHDRCVRSVREKFSTLFEPSFRHFEPPDVRKWKRHGDKICVGFFASPNQGDGLFRCLRGVIERLDPKRFDIVLIYHYEDDPLLHLVRDEHLRRLVYVDDFEQTVEILRMSGLDILYYWKAAEDLWSTFLPMCRPAPVQCTSWGTHGTSGLSSIDYYLSWDAAEIPEAQDHYTEKLIRLKTPPNFEIDDPSNITASREELGLPTKGTLYFCPHRLSKYHPDFDFYLRDILQQNRTGHMILLFGRENSQSLKIKDRIRHMIGDVLFRRMIFLPTLEPQRYYKYLSVTDIVLDSPFYAGELTSYDALSRGIPVVTQSGELLVQRYTAARYREMKIDKAPIASNREEYVAWAVRLGTCPEERTELSEQIACRSSRLRGDIKIVNEYERFFEMIGETGNGCQRSPKSNESS